MYRYPQLQDNVELVEKEKRPITGSKKEPAWWMSWEFYLIVSLTIGLRLYRVDTAQYMVDHNTFYQMAHNAISNGLWPISGNRSSTGPLIPPLFVYVMMIPALITPDPVAGNILIALSNIAAVLLTYIFVRLYYGRPAGAIAALLYATAINVIIFSRDIWQPDLLPLLMVVLLFVLFRGVVQKKYYWFSPAVLLIVVMYQLHSTAVYLVVPLFVVVLLAFRTIRWQEVLLTALGLLLLFSPYLYLEHRRQFVDVVQLFQVARSPAIFSKDALLLYLAWMHSYVLNPLQYQIIPPNISVDTHLIPSNVHSILLTTPLYLIAQFSHLESRLMELLLAGSILMAVILILWPARSSEHRGVSGWWKELLNAPQRHGLLILLVWQATFLLLLRHSIPLYIHYLIYILPGPFILIGILLGNVLLRMQRLRFSWKRLVSYGLYGVVGLIVVVQTVGSVGWLVDHARGNFDNNYAFPQYFDLATIQRIVSITDHMAQQHHLGRAYVDIHGDDVPSVNYLSQFARTSMEVIDSDQCLVLPNIQNGPVMYVTDPNRPDIDALLKRYTLATQVGEIQHPGGMPFKIYILRTRPGPRPSLQLSDGVQLFSQKADTISIKAGNPQLLVTRWKVQTIEVPQPRFVYKYRFLSYTPIKFVSNIINNNGGNDAPLCRLSRTWAGDELIPLFEFNGNAPSHLTMAIEKFNSIPQHYDHGALQMVIYDNIDTPRVVLRMRNKKGTINLSVSPTNTPHKGYVAD